jgi:hypothetical protein
MLYDTRYFKANVAFNAAELGSHVQYNWKTLNNVRSHHLGFHFMEPSGCLDAELKYCASFEVWDC